ncbi:hydrogenase maturation protease [Anaerolineae bacterium]|nr:hydrogenase maturation protease [Anaerolineae bacterium]
MSGPLPASPRPGILILGIGNLLLGDEGVGVHAAQHLAALPWPENVTVVDGGTGGFHLLSLFADHDILVLIDATLDDNPPGTVRELRPRFANDYPRTLSAHDIGLRDLVETAALTGAHPDVHLIIVSIRSVQNMSTELSPEVAAALPDVVARVHRILHTLAP